MLDELPPPELAPPNAFAVPPLAPDAGESSSQAMALALTSNKETTSRLSTVLLPGAKAETQHTLL